MAAQPLQQYISPEYAASALDVSVWTVRLWIRTGRLKAYRIGGQNKLIASDVEAFVREYPVSQERNAQAVNK